VYDRETGNSTLMTNRYGSAFRPAISPDGKWLVYGSRDGAQTGCVFATWAMAKSSGCSTRSSATDGSRATLDVIPRLQLHARFEGDHHLARR
jgi:Tol biopolymer transport system component